MVCHLLSTTTFLFAANSPACNGRPTANGGVGDGVPSEKRRRGRRRGVAAAAYLRYRRAFLFLNVTYMPSALSALACLLGMAVSIATYTFNRWPGDTLFTPAHALHGLVPPTFTYHHHTTRTPHLPHTRFTTLSLGVLPAAAALMLHYLRCA